MKEKTLIKKLLIYEIPEIYRKEVILFNIN